MADPWSIDSGLASIMPIMSGCLGKAKNKQLQLHPSGPLMIDVYRHPSLQQKDSVECFLHFLLVAAIREQCCCLEASITCNNNNNALNATIASLIWNWLGCQQDGTEMTLGPLLLPCCDGDWDGVAASSEAAAPCRPFFEGGVCMSLPDLTGRLAGIVIDLESDRRLTSQVLDESQMCKRSLLEQQLTTANHTTTTSPSDPDRHYCNNIINGISDRQQHSIFNHNL